MTDNNELKMILRHWPEPPYQCGSAPDIMEKALARIEELEKTTAAPDLLKYANHLTDCRYRGGHDCDCGLDEIRAAARSGTSTDRPVASRPDPTGLHPTACYCRTRMERSHCAYEKRGECTRGLAVSSPDRAGK